MDKDRLNSKQYARALSKFIRNADTPVTLGIQGGWDGKNAIFWIGITIESFDQKKFAQDSVISSIVDKAVEAYKITKKAAVKM